MKRILVTGGSGFLGRRLVPSLLASGVEVVSPTSQEWDLAAGKGDEAYRDTVFDEIWHLAAWTQAGTFCDTRRGDQWLVNQQINTNVLQFWNRFQPKAKMVALGTSVSYASEEDLRESCYLDGHPKDRFLSYAMCKRMLLVGLQALSRQYGMNYLYLVPSTLYGPNYHVDGRQLHFIYDLIRKILNAQKGGGPVVLWGDGHQSRELVYVDDFVDVAQRLNEHVENDIINIGAGDGFTIREFAASICELVGYDVSLIQYDESKYVGAKSKCLSVEKLNSLCPNRSATSLRDGLRETIRWVADRLDALNENAETI